MNINDMKMVLFNEKKKRKLITLKDLAALINIEYYNTRELYQWVTSLQEEKIIEPIERSGLNGNSVYRMFKKYRIIVSEEVDEIILSEIKRLHPKLLKNGYLLNNSSKYIEYKDYILMLNNFLFNYKKDLKISRKERSFQIFGKEKMLEDKTFYSILKKLELLDDLNYYDTPEEFYPEYIPAKKDRMTLLICENKDIWFDIRKLMFEDGVFNIFGMNIDGVIFGRGNAISAIKWSFSKHCEFNGYPDAHFLYWGDIDLEGFSIFERFVQYNPELNIDLFVNGYSEMIERAKKLPYLEDSESKKNIVLNKDMIFSSFSEEDREFIDNVLYNKKLIPQEIITYLDLRDSV